MEENALQLATEALQQAKSAHKRLDRMEIMMDEIRKDIKSTNAIAISVEKLATEMKAMREDCTDINARLKQLEEKPAKEYEESRKEVKKQIITFIFGIALSFIAFKLGLDKFI